MKYFYILILLSFLLTAGCEGDDECTGTVEAVYELGVDPTSDFSVSNVASTATVLSSDCDNLPVGSTVSETVDTLERSGSDITLTERSGTINMSVSDTSVSEFSRSHTIAGCTLTVVMTGSLNSTENNMTTSGSFVAKGLTCSL